MAIWLHRVQARAYHAAPSRNLTSKGRCVLVMLVYSSYVYMQAVIFTTINACVCVCVCVKIAGMYAGEGSRGRQARALTIDTAVVTRRDARVTWTSGTRPHDRHYST